MSKIPSEILTQHIAALGKTGSGKTSTAKLVIEQAVANGSRVCVLDPIKSDWWGLTSSRNGTRGGLPFHILGGPHGHVPLHSSAGKAIAEVVASGDLPLSVIDMADFEPGGLSKFFVDFAPTLLKKMRGVLYLVLEEAHLFAPKERGGIGDENMAVYYAKLLATAGRSKGIRLVLVTQRTQALHNALLGSVDTLIAHRLTAPADQEPVIKWLKANTTPDVLARVVRELASLKTGDGWICSGEARIFERAHFDRIATYDNTATPTGDLAVREIKTAAIDHEKLRTIIGHAVEEAKANDPKELKAKLATVTAELAQLKSAPPVAAARTVEKAVEVSVLTDADRKKLDDLVVGLDAVLAGVYERLEAAVDASFARVTEPLRKHLATMTERLAPILEKAATAARPAPPATPPLATMRRPAIAMPPVRTATTNGHAPGDVALDKCARAILSVLANYPEGCTAGKLTLLTGYRYSGGFKNSLSDLRTAGYMEGGNTGTMTITPAGAAVATPVTMPAPGPELAAYWATHGSFDKCARAILAALVTAPEGMTADALCAATGYQYSGGFKNSLSDLRTAGVLLGKNTETMTAHPDLLGA